MASCSVIGADIQNTENPSIQQNQRNITVYFGVFFDGQGIGLEATMISRLLMIMGD